MATFTDKANDTIEKGAEVVDTAIIGAADKASDATKRAKVLAQDAVESSRDTLETALVCAKDVVRANPIMAVAAVAAIAYLCGRIKG